MATASWLLIKNIKDYTSFYVILPNADTLAAFQQGVLSISHLLSKKSQTATVLPNLKSSSLILLGQVCDDNCTIVLHKTKLYTIKSNKIDIKIDKKDIFMEGTKNHQDGLYDIPVTKTTITNNNVVLPQLHCIISAQQRVNKMQQNVTNKYSF